MASVLELASKELARLREVFRRRERKPAPPFGTTARVAYDEEQAFLQSEILRLERIVRQEERAAGRSPGGSSSEGS